MTYKEFAEKEKREFNAQAIAQIFYMGAQLANDTRVSKAAETRLKRLCKMLAEKDVVESAEALYDRMCR